MSNEFDTGVDESLEAAETDLESFESDETTLSPSEEAEPESYNFADFFKDEPDEGNAEEGPDSPPSQEEPKETTQEKPADYYRSQEEVDAIVQKRLKQARASWDKEQAAKREADAELDRQAAEFVKNNPETKLPIEFVKTLLKANQPQPAQPAEPEQFESSPEDKEQQKFKAWKQSLIDEEPLLRIETGNPKLTVKGYANENAAFKTALAQGLTPLQAYRVVQEVEKTAAANAQKAVLQNIKDSNARATTPVSNAKSTGQPRSMIDRINSLNSIEDIDKMFDDAERQGKKGITL
jgi:hypothetical protein